MNKKIFIVLLFGILFLPNIKTVLANTLFSYDFNIVRVHIRNTERITNIYEWERLVNCVYESVNNWRNWINCPIKIYNTFTYYLEFNNIWDWINFLENNVEYRRMKIFLIDSELHFGDSDYMFLKIYGGGFGSIFDSSAYIYVYTLTFDTYFEYVLRTPYNWIENILTFNIGLTLGFSGCFWCNWFFIPCVMGNVRNPIYPEPCYFCINHFRYIAYNRNWL